MTLKDLIKKAQAAIGVTADGDWGPVTTAKAEEFELVAVSVKAKPKAEAPKPGELPVPASLYWKPLVINGVNVHPIFSVPAPFTHLHPYDFMAKFIGEHEISGSKDNVLIAHTHEHCKNLGLHSDKNDYHDEVANCSSGMNWTADGTGCEKSDNALAASWDKGSFMGEARKRGGYIEKGDIVTIRHATGGRHVFMANKRTLWDGSGNIEALGFNQGNSVKVSAFPKAHIVAAHAWKPKPGVKHAPIGTKALPVTGEVGESTR